jgi:hypothetical protein
MPATVSEAAEKLYPGMTFDTALPQTWVNFMTKMWWNPVGYFVWGYPKEHSVMGAAAPISIKACKFIIHFLELYGDNPQDHIRAPYITPEKWHDILYYERLRHQD